MTKWIKDTERYVFAMLPHIWTFILGVFITTWLLTKVQPLFWEGIVMVVAGVMIFFDVKERIEKENKK